MDLGFNCYHVFNKSIAGYVIFRDSDDYLRMLGILNYYRFISPPVKYSIFISAPESFQLSQNMNSDVLVRLLAYCLMPTHFHFVVQTNYPTGLSEYLKIVLNAYTRYFNQRYGRKGPLWQGRVKRVSVGVGESFLHVTRYVHLNPVTAYMVDDPVDWEYSSYGAYVGNVDKRFTGMVCKDYVEMSSNDYRKFVTNHKEEQRLQAKYNKLFLE